MIYITRNGKHYGPYDESTVLTFVNEGRILLMDKAVDADTNRAATVGDFLKKWGVKPQIVNEGNLVSQLKTIGSELVIPKQAFKDKVWLSDKRLMSLALAGMLPLGLGSLMGSGFLMFYFVSLYFSAVWAMFFYYLFKTKQVALKTTLSVFFSTQICMLLVWWLLGLNSLNPFYLWVDKPFPLNLFGFVFGVGVTEEFVKLIPLLIIYKYAKEPLVPQTVVFYGLISGIAFGVFEGVEYQMSVNSKLSYGDSFLYNIARLTSLPFFHAVWCGIAGYFISFAKLYPKYRLSLYFLTIAIPATLHGLYDTFSSGIWSFLIAYPLAFASVVLLMTYLNDSAKYQSKLRN
ncbi:MAG: PrsW family intramembrane metalloprotease [Paludibacteraceae bacterium]|nr:PrsW family intramembrane metalloprotease [Paludibacteraceae bacterium]